MTMRPERSRNGLVARMRDQARRCEDLRQQLDALEERFGEVEQQNASLAGLYAASYQLHASVRKAEVLLAIQEIVINLLGSEELAVLAHDGGRLTPLASVGVDGARLAALRIEGSGLLARAFTARTPQFAEAAVGDAAGLTACIPLVLDGRVLAVVAVFRLLPQKPVLDGFDRELCDLLALQGATALYCADLHDQHGARE
jgi:hypothetical protein